MEIEDAIEQIIRGNAVLFIGAGFSKGATNQMPEGENEIPTAREFADFLSSELIDHGLPDQGTGHALQVVSDYFIQEVGETELVKCLIDNFSVRDISDDQREIAKLPWRRVYTTNYDNVFEFAANRERKAWTSLTTKDGITASKNKVVHINGHINDLTVKTLKDKVKLTHSSYSASDFSSSKWSQQLRRDFENATAIFFIGYSVYDIEVSRILFDTDLKNRTFFIVHENESDIGIATAKKYGKVLKIGTRGFSDKIRKAPKNLDPQPYTLTWLEQYIRPESLLEPTDDHTINLITYGTIKPEVLAYDLSSDISRYAIKRSEVGTVLSLIENGRKHFVIHSDLGNGKTLLKYQLSQKLSLENYSVFWDTNRLLNYRSDLRHLEKRTGKIALFLDEYPDKIALIETLNSMNFDNVVVFVLTRTIRYELGQSRYDNVMPEYYISLASTNFQDRMLKH